MIRQSTAKDLDCIMEIWLKGNLDAHNFVPAQYWKDNYEYVRDAISDGVTVYEDDGIIRGFIGVREGYIAGLFVDEKYRGNKIGQQLINYEKNHCLSLFLDVFIENERAVMFYRREGFKVIKSHLNEDTNAKEYTMQWSN